MYRPDYIKNTTSLMPSWVKEENTTRKYVSLYHPNFNMDGIVDETDKINFWVPDAGKGSQVPE